MNASRYSAKLKESMDGLLRSMVEPGYDDFTKYREAVAKWQALNFARQELNLATVEDDEAGT